MKPPSAGRLRRATKPSSSAQHRIKDSFLHQVLLAFRTHLGTHRTYDAQNCSAARALELVGERWSLLIIRDALFAGHARFADFQRSLGVAPNILTNRLDGFVAAGLMERRRYSEHPEHYEYLLTGNGRDLAPVIVALSAWGDQHAAPHGPPIRHEHATCGSQIQQQIRCAACGEQVRNTGIRARPGPGPLPPEPPDDPAAGHR